MTYNVFGWTLNLTQPLLKPTYTHLAGSEQLCENMGHSCMPPRRGIMNVQSNKCRTFSLTDGVPVSLLGR